MSFVLNSWYVAGWSEEFADGLIPLEITGQRLVLFRDTGNTLFALEDRCPHRLLPLSKGKKIGDTVQCGYHGMTFDGSGACVRVPGQDNTPERANVRAFPIVERHGIVWVWMGDPSLADPATIFDVPEMSDPAWHMHHGGHLNIRAHYLNVAENLVDPAHVSFVHPTTLGNAASEDVPEDRRVFTDLTVIENLVVGQQPKRDGAVTWTQEMLFDLFPNLAERRNNRGKALSGGEQQMLTIARTLMGNPYFVLLDEPSEGVAPVIVEQMVKVIRQLKSEGLTILLSEQNLHFAQAVSDRAVIIESGEQKFVGTLQELNAKPDIRDMYLAA